MPTILRLKKGEDRRVRHGHPWIFSNEIDTKATPLSSFSAGEIVNVVDYQQKPIGSAYINPQSLISARLFSRELDADMTVAFFLDKLKTALSIRDMLFSAPYYRLVFGEGDGLPGLIIDRFANDFVIQCNTAGMDRHLVRILPALQQLFPTLHSVFLHNDSAMRGHEGLELYSRQAYGNVPEIIQLEENNVKFCVPLAKGQKTGWFYDHRMNRLRLQQYAKNKTVLDVFSYVGGWGIQAAALGATSVDFVDASQLACEFVANNVALNKINTKVNIIHADVFDALKTLRQENKTYDLIIVDPPAFIKKAKDSKAGMIAYQRVNEAAFKLLNANGILISCSCSMHLKMEDLLQIIKRSAFNTQSDIQVLERGHQGPDHPLHPAIPETDYLKAWWIRKLNK